jgi:hypothetical protein
MTPQSNQKSLPLATGNWAEIYRFSNYTKHQYDSLNKDNLKEPEGEYSTTHDKNSLNLHSLRDQLEAHLARYHFHQLSLLAIAHSEHYTDNSEWEFGAYLTGQELQQQGEKLIKQLSTQGIPYTP